MSSLQLGVMDRILTIRAEDGIGGVATSGLGGRSMTRGIAQGVSVFPPVAYLQMLWRHTWRIVLMLSRNMLLLPKRAMLTRAAILKTWMLLYA